jgi:hypothetical protein
MPSGSKTPKGVMPPQLAGKGFDVHPENRNKKGPPKDAVALRKMIQDMGDEEIEVTIGKGKNRKTVKMTRTERILLEWYESERVQKQELLMGYGYGKPAENINISGELKVIKVALKKKQETDNEQPT